MFKLAFSIPPLPMGRKSLLISFLLSLIKLVGFNNVYVRFELFLILFELDKYFDLSCNWSGVQQCKLWKESCGFHFKFGSGLSAGSVEQPNFIGMRFLMFNGLFGISKDAGVYPQGNREERILENCALLCYLLICRGFCLSRQEVCRHPS